MKSKFKLKFGRWYGNIPMYGFILLRMDDVSGYPAKTGFNVSLTWGNKGVNCWLGFEHTFTVKGTLDE